MDVPDPDDRVTAIAGGLAVLFLPALFVAFTLVFLEFSEAVLLTELSTLELVELYLIELVLFAIVIYGLYRVAVGGLKR